MIKIGKVGQHMNETNDVRRKLVLSILEESLNQLPTIDIIHKKEVNAVEAPIQDFNADEYTKIQEDKDKHELDDDILKEMFNTAVQVASESKESKDLEVNQENSVQAVSRKSLERLEKEYNLACLKDYNDNKAATIVSNGVIQRKSDDFKKKDKIT